jgi:hypothetical protein
MSTNQYTGFVSNVTMICMVCPKVSIGLVPSSERRVTSG